MYALIENGAVTRYPYSLSDIKKANPNTSFPAVVSDATMLEHGAHRVYQSTPPVFDAVTQTLEEATPVFSIADIRWTQVWAVRDLTAGEIQQRFDAQADAVREERNQKLKDSDWTQVADAPVDKAAWAAYRQALRDITTQDGFPHNVTWPTQP